MSARPARAVRAARPSRDGELPGERGRDASHGAPLISVMETTHLWNHDDRSIGFSGRWSVIGGVFLEPEVRAGPMVVLDVACEDTTKMRLADDDHVIETLASDGSDQALDERILPRTRLRRYPCQPVGAGTRRRRYRLDLGATTVAPCRQETRRPLVEQSRSPSDEP